MIGVGEEEMIINCRKCESRFRFDDMLMTGEGVWVRCSRCQEVFFQENPNHQEITTPCTNEQGMTTDQAGPAATDWPSLDEEAGRREFFREADSDMDREPALRRVMNEIRQADHDGGPGSLVKEFGDLGDFTTGENEAEQTDAWQEPAEAAVSKKKHPVLKFLAYLFLMLLVIILSGGLYFWIFPQSRQQAADSLSPYFPWAGNLGTLGQTGPVWSQVALQDVRQHFVNNWLMGNLRIVEGSVVNKGKYTLSNVQVRGRLYDNRGSVIGEWTSYCGNLLTDSELSTLTEEEIKHKLSQPLVGNGTSDRLNPNGQIPFMIVVAHHDQQAVAKTTVIVTGAEKVL